MLLGLRFFQFLLVPLDHEADLLVEVGWQTLLQIGTYLLTILAMAITDSEKVAVLQVAEMWHCYPDILIYLFRIGGRNPRFGRECKFSDTVRAHLLWVCTGVRKGSRWVFTCSLGLVVRRWPHCLRTFSNFLMELLRVKFHLSLCPFVAIFAIQRCTAVSTLFTRRPLSTSLVLLI